MLKYDYLKMVTKLNVQSKIHDCFFVRFVGATRPLSRQEKRVLNYRVMCKVCKNQSFKDERKKIKLCKGRLTQFVVKSKIKIVLLLYV